MTEQAAPRGLSAMRRELGAYADRSGEPVSLALLCRFAGRRWTEATVAVSVPLRVLGAPGAATVAAADLAREGEELQVTLGEGPTLDVLAGASPVSVADLGEGEWAVRWPMFVEAASALGLRSVKVLPMRVGAARFGAFVIYGRKVCPPTATEGVEVVALASIALDLLLDDLSSVDGVVSSAGLVEDRPEIHQATGMVSVQLGVDLPTALLRLRARAFAENRRLSHVAADVVSRVLRFDGIDGAGRVGRTE